ncbi:MAG TPA: c-type cytochrome domain-containing protein, partial [Planctomycetota bacterium]|nr:c-type cytochrome domain-containing protein [Planctomycetota bacterium]
MKRFASVLVLLALGASPQETPPAPDRDGVEFFEKKIRPVLVDRCYSCHSAEAKKLKGELTLDSRDGWVKGGETGPSIVPGDPDKSLLIQAIRYAGDLKMPPKGKLSKDVVDDFVAWVKRGAPDPRGKGAPPAAKKGLNIDAGRSYWA